MDPNQLYAALIGSGTIIGGLATTVYKLLNGRIAALEAENKVLREEAKAAVSAKDDEIATLRKIAQELSAERVRADAVRRQP